MGEPLAGEESAGWISRILYLWMTPHLAAGMKEVVQHEHIPALVESKTAAFLGRGFRAEVALEIAKPADIRSPVSPALRTIKGETNIIIFWSVLTTILYYVSPILLSLLLAFFREESDDATYGYLLSAGLFLAAILTPISLAAMDHQVMKAAIKLKSCMAATVVRKALLLSARSRRENPAGKIVNLVAADADRLVKTAALVPFVWMSILQLIMGSALLAYLTKWTAVVTVAVLLIIVFPILTLLSIGLGGKNHKLHGIADKRVVLMKEILTGIRPVKLFGWEFAFGDVVRKIRDKELDLLATIHVIRAGFFAMIVGGTVIVSIATLGTMAGAEVVTFDAETVFTVLSVIGILQFPLSLLPLALLFVVLGRQSLVRLFDFMCAEELGSLEGSDSVNVLQDENEAPSAALVFRGASFAWDPREELEKKKNSSFSANSTSSVSGEGDVELTEVDVAHDTENESPESVSVRAAGSPVISGLDFEIKKGSLVFICGPVGCGKSTFLESCVGSSYTITGQSGSRGTMAYAAQEPWIFNATLEKNVIFNSVPDKARLDEVVKTCQLTSDLEILPGGLKTELGSTGVNLSGGQKARVALARAVYSTSDIVLMDDPISAVDAHVGKSLMEDCVMGALKGRTRVMATNQLQYLSKGDAIIHLARDGSMAGFGTYSELMSDSPAFRELMEEFVAEHERQIAQDAKEADETPLAGDTVEEIFPNLTEDKKAAVTAASGPKESSSVVDSDSSKLVAKEDRVTGALSFGVVMRYIKAAGGWPWVLVLFVLTLSSRAALIAASSWVGYWTEQNNRQTDMAFYFGIYTALGVGAVFLAFIRGYVLAKGLFRVSKVMHEKLYTSVMLSPLSFFDANPVGRLLTRFSKDLLEVDTYLAGQMASVVMNIGALVGTLGYIFFTVPYLLILVPLALPLGLRFQNRYRTSLRELRRLEAIKVSPVVSHVAENLEGSGLSTVKAYQASDMVAKESERRVDDVNIVTYHMFSCYRWMEVRMGIIGALLIGGACALMVWQRDNYTAAEVGVILTFAMILPGFFSWFLKNTAELEALMTSAERIEHYCLNLESEARSFTPEDENPPPADWPSSGHLVFKDVEIRYREDLPNALNSLSLDIPAGTRLGVVGRTGAGKSTILGALFRTLESHNGTIHLDGRNIKTEVGITELRRKLSIVPQDPVMFRGTLRFNIDPFDEFPDLDLWEALGSVGLQDILNTLSVEELNNAASEAAAAAAMKKKNAEPSQPRRRGAPAKEEAVETQEELENRIADESIAEKVQRILELSISNGGSPLSVGQRQLVCLARALVRRTQIVALDESTAALDKESEKAVQEALARSFNAAPGKGPTVITIAHRLATVVGACNMVLVLDKGSVVEYDTPQALLDDSSSEFSALVDATGVANAAALRNLARGVTSSGTSTTSDGHGNVTPASSIEE